MTEKKVLYVSPEIHKKIKMVAVLKEMKLYEVIEGVLKVYSDEILKKFLEEL